MARRRETQKLFLSSSELINAAELVQKIAADTCRKMGSRGCRAASGFSRAGEAGRESRGSGEFWTRQSRVRIFGSQETRANEIVRALLASRTEGGEGVESADSAGLVRSMRLRRFVRQAVCPQSQRHLYSRFVLRHFSRLGACTFHAQAHIPAQPAPPVQETRLPFADEDAGGPEGFVAAPRQGAQARFGQARIPRVARDVRAL
jgi:hypothetical protein